VANHAARDRVGQKHFTAFEKADCTVRTNVALIVGESSCGGGRRDKRCAENGSQDHPSLPLAPGALWVSGFSSGSSFDLGGIMNESLHLYEIMSI
jgi:hypothetical protein